MMHPETNSPKSTEATRKGRLNHKPGAEIATNEEPPQVREDDSMTTAREPETRTTAGVILGRAPDIAPWPSPGIESAKEVDCIGAEYIFRPGLLLLTEERTMDGAEISTLALAGGFSKKGGVS